MASSLPDCCASVAVALALFEYTAEGSKSLYGYDSSFLKEAYITTLIFLSEVCDSLQVLRICVLFFCFVILVSFFHSRYNGARPVTTDSSMAKS